jgi:hypothetical protein
MYKELSFCHIQFELIFGEPRLELLDAVSQFKLTTCCITWPGMIEGIGLLNVISVYMVLKVMTTDYIHDQ